MNGQPSPNQGGIAQLAGGMGGMGGNPTLGGAPQTPPMPQGAQQPPQQAPQGGLPPDLLKALAAAKVKKMQDAAKRELELQMAQQQAASGEGNKTVVQQLQEGVEKDTAQEMMQALSGGIKQAGQMSAQPQGQPQPSPMSGGIAAAPGANQAAQPEAMAAGGIVAFKKGGTDGEEDDQPVDAYNRASNETWLGQGIRRGKAAVKDVAGLLSLRPWATNPERVAEGDTRTNAEVEGYTPEGYKVNDRADQLKAAFDRQQAARPPAVTQDRPLPPTTGQNAADYEDMRPQGGIATTLPRPPAQRPPVAAINQAPRPPAPAPNLNIQTNPNYAPPAAAGDAGGLSGLMAEQLKNRIGAKPEDAEAAAIKKYKELTAVDPELAAELKAATAAERAALQTRSTRKPSVYDKLRAFADVAPAGGQTWTMAGAKGAGNVNRLEKEYEADRMAALSGLKGLSKAEYDKQQGEKEKLYGVGAAANKTALESLDKAMTNATHLLNTQSVAETARQQNISQEKVAKERNESQERIQRMHSAAMRDSRVIPVMEQMNEELRKADTDEKRNAIVTRYSQIANTLKPNQAAIRGESKLLGDALTYLRESNRDYRKATPEVKKQMEDDVLRRYGEGAPAAGSDGGFSKSAIDAEIARRGG